ncbi:FKBP-like protein [Cladorrhinum sp. PSN259]|nr:FKBP-like protein [Cladorrhinum sp. PSN259]
MGKKGGGDSGKKGGGGGAGAGGSGSGGKGKGKGGKGGGGGDDNANDTGKGGAGGKKAGAVKGAQSINVRHILCEKHGEREKALERLANKESFKIVAETMSLDKPKQGGLLGWKTKGSLDPEFEKVAYGLPASTVDNPSIGLAHTPHGYHIIMVEGRK